MAIVRNNSVTQGFSGMLDNLIVFRQLNGKTIVAKRPRPARRQSAQQRENRMRFHDATVFAKSAMYDPQKKAYYWKMAQELKLPNAYTAAITEYMRKDKPAQPTTQKVQPSAIENTREVPGNTITPGSICYPASPGYTVDHPPWTVTWSSMPLQP